MYVPCIVHAMLYNSSILPFDQEFGESSIVGVDAHSRRATRRVGELHPRSAATSNKRTHQSLPELDGIELARNPGSHLILDPFSCLPHYIATPASWPLSSNQIKLSTNSVAFASRTIEISIPVNPDPFVFPVTANLLPSCPIRHPNHRNCYPS